MGPGQGLFPHGPGGGGIGEDAAQCGRERFDIYCAPCHGKLGDGNGITKKLGVMPAVKDLHEKPIVEMTDGEIFNTITFGKNTMGAYGPTVPAEDRWVKAPPKEDICYATQNRRRYRSSKNIRDCNLREHRG